MINKRLVTIVVLAIMAIGLVVVLIVSHQKPVSNIVFIRGLEKCSAEIGDERVKALGGDLYGNVALANTYNKTKSLPTYEASVREGGCGETKSNTTKDYNGKQVTVYTSSALIDVPEAKQSWQIRYDWLPGGSESVDLGTLAATCPTTDKLLYGDFSCDKVLSLQKYGTPDYDPILQYMPYTGEGFTLDYSPATRQVYATIIIPANQKGNTELIQNNEAIVPYWFERRGLDINKYKVSYDVSYE